MILDMIQGCRYLRSSMDRWLLSKNSTTRLEGLESWHGAGLLWKCSMPITNTKGLYLYHGSNMTPSRPWLQHLSSKINTMVSCPSRTRHQFSPFLYSIHVITHSRMLSAFTRGTVLQPNDNVLPTQMPLRNALRKTFCRMVLFYQIRPTCQFLSYSNFWC
jgi:hypothetical protein